MPLYDFRCTACQARFDDLTDTIFAGHHQPLRIWILCLYIHGPGPVEPSGRPGT